MCQETDSVVPAAPVEPRNQQQEQPTEQQEQQQPPAELSRRRRISSRMKRAAAAATTLDQQHRPNNGHHRNAFNNGRDDAATATSAETTTSSSPASTTTESSGAGRNNAPGLGRLFVCAMGICVCYLYYGILQERLFSGGHGGGETRRLGATFVLVTQCIANVFVARFWQYVQDVVLASSSNHEKNKNTATRGNDNDNDDKTKTSGLHHSLLLLTSGCYVAAMACSNEAIQYVSYPVAVLVKSCKLIPSMVVGQVVEGRLYSQREWMAALLISAGIVLFHSHRLFLQQQNQNSSSSSSNGNKQHKNVLFENDDDKDSGGHLYGLMLLLVSLAMDGLLSSCQNFLKRKPTTAAVSDDTTSNQKNKSNNNRMSSYRPPNAVETMLYINLYALIFLIPLAMVAGQWNEGIHRLLQQNSSSSSNNKNVLVGRDLFWALLLLNITVAIGQIFIFLTIHWYTPLVTTTITTTRKFFTILLSVLTFGHEFTTTQWTAVVLVFVGLYLSILSNTNTGTTTTKSSTTKSASAARERTTSEDDSGLHKKMK